MRGTDEQFDRYRGGMRRCRQCERAFHLRETVLVQIGNEREVFCNNATDRTCSARYFSRRGCEPNCIPMAYVGRGINGMRSAEFLPEYRGPVQRCIQCGAKFERGDVVCVCTGEIVLCGDLRSGCSMAHRRHHAFGVPQGRTMCFIGPSITAQAQGAGKRIGEFIRHGPPHAVTFALLLFAAAVLLVWLFTKR